MLKSLCGLFGSADLEQSLSPRAKIQEKLLRRNLLRTGLSLLTWLLVGTGALLIYSLTACYSNGQCATSGWNIFSIGLLLALASASSGGLLGFLFGIPRTLAKEPWNNKDKNQSAPDSQATGNKPEEKGTAGQAVNTNLEEISDWLTKILVGAGLVQLQNIPEMLHKVGTHFQTSLGNSELVILGVVINFSVWGFFSGYLLTRLFLAGAFKLADEGIGADRIIQEVKTSVQIGEALRETKQYTRARIEYEKALSKIDENTPKEVKRKLYEEIVFNSLYDNYEDAIDYALRYFSEEPKTPSPLIDAYLGFAYGQQYREKKAQKEQAASEKREDQVQALTGEMVQIRVKALESIRKALKLDPTLKPLILTVWDPKSPGSEDNDLEVFKDDTEFKELLQGLPERNE